MTDLMRLIKNYNIYSDVHENKIPNERYLQFVTNSYGDYEEELFYDLANKKLIYAVTSSDGGYMKRIDYSYKEMADDLEGESPSYTCGYYDQMVYELDEFCNEIEQMKKEGKDSEYRDDSLLENTPVTFIGSVAVTNRTVFKISASTPFEAFDKLRDMPDGLLNDNEYLFDYEYELIDVKEAE